VFARSGCIVTFSCLFVFKSEVGIEMGWTEKGGVTTRRLQVAWCQAQAMKMQ